MSHGHQQGPYDPLVIGKESAARGRLDTGETEILSDRKAEEWWTKTRDPLNPKKGAVRTRRLPG